MNTREKQFVIEQIVQNVNSLSKLTAEYQGYLKKHNQGGDWGEHEFMQALNKRANKIGENLKKLGYAE